MERLGHAVDAPVARDEAAVGDRVAVASQPASVGPRSHDIAPRLPSSAFGPVALGADPGVPVAGRARRWVGRDRRR